MGNPPDNVMEARADIKDGREVFTFIPIGKNDESINKILLSLFNDFKNINF